MHTYMHIIYIFICIHAICIHICIVLENLVESKLYPPVVTERGYETAISGATTRSP